MSRKDCNLPLSPAYLDRLRMDYLPEHVQAFEQWRYAQLTEQPGEQIPYVRVGQTTISHQTKTPVLYVPGFTEGIVAKAPFAAEMAELGCDIILPGQNRRKILRDTLRKKNATYSQAMNYMAVLGTERLLGEEGSVDVITHSYGSLIFEAMHEIAEARHSPVFKGSRVVMLAPGGSNKKEGLVRLGARFGKHMIAEGRTEKDFHDIDGEMLKAGTKNFMANVPRGLREIGHLAKRRVDYERLTHSGLALLAVLGYAEDTLFPESVLESTMADAMHFGDLNATAFLYGNPYSLQRDGDRLRGGKDASHNDEQFNPRRVAAAVSQILRSN